MLLKWLITDNPTIGLVVFRKFAHVILLLIPFLTGKNFRCTNEKMICLLIDIIISRYIHLLMVIWLLKILVNNRFEYNWFSLQKYNVHNIKFIFSTKSQNYVYNTNYPHQHIHLNSIISIRVTLMLIFTTQWHITEYKDIDRTNMGRLSVRLVKYVAINSTLGSSVSWAQKLLCSEAQKSRAKNYFAFEVI